jgi:hypothetical protein
LPITLACPLPASHQYGEFFLATDEWREMALTGAATAAARPDYPEQTHRLRHTFQRMAAALLGDKKACDLPLDPRGDHDRPRLG